jgi:RNA polymerase sigma-70 factor (ECF subfamily)
VLTADDLVAERRLIEASQKDPRSFDKLYERYFYRVYAFALARTGDASMAEDVTSETFRQAFQNLARFQWRGVPFSAWLFRIAANNVSDMRKHGPGQTALQDLPEDPVDPADELAQIEERVQLYEFVDRLPADQRRVIVLRFAQEKRVSEIAAAMGKSEGAVKQLQFRALRSLRELVGETYD